MKISILDFDLTMTKIHTFKQRGLRAPSALSIDVLAEQGATDAQSNLKEGINSEQAPFKFDSNEIFCIATYHNNPAYIMGYLRVLLGKQITETRCINEESNGIALMECAVEGIDIPLLISFLPQYGTEFNATRSRLHGKNEQIMHLRSALESQGLLLTHEVCDFYDDDEANIKASADLNYIRANSVSTEKRFRVLSTAAEKIPGTQTITLENIHSWGIAQRISSAKAKVALRSTTKGIIVEDPVNGLVIVHGQGKNPPIEILIANDIQLNPSTYATKQDALAYFESVGVDVQTAYPVTQQDIRSWGIVHTIDGASAEALVNGTHTAIIRNASNGDLIVTQGQGDIAPNHLLISEDMIENPNEYATKQKALEWLERTGVDISLAKPVTLETIRSWGIVKTIGREEAELLVKRTPKAIIRESSSGSLAVTKYTGPDTPPLHTLIDEDMLLNPSKYSTKNDALTRFESVGVDVSSVRTPISSARKDLGLFPSAASGTIEADGAYKPTMEHKLT